MELLSLVTAAVAGISTGLISNAVTGYLSRRRSTKLAVTLPSGRSYEIATTRGNQMEIEKLLRSLMYSTTQDRPVYASNVRLLEDVIRPSLEALKDKFDEVDVRVQLRGFDQLPALTLDPAAMQLVTFNLLMNAAKYAPRGATVLLDALLLRDAVEIRFMNPTRTGIRPEDTERVFEKGFRGEEASLREPSGMGVGLWVARSLVRAHGGDVFVHPENELFVTTVRLPHGQEAMAT